MQNSCRPAYSGLVGYRFATLVTETRLWSNTQTSRLNGKLRSLEGLQRSTRRKKSDLGEKKIRIGEKDFV